jgi:tryptophan synthase alpha chain
MANPSKYTQLHQTKKRIFIPFFMIGDPDYQTSLELVIGACNAGADAIELGIPYTDPIADGPVIQRSNIRAFEAGINLSKVFRFISDVRSHVPSIPIGILTYYNLIFSNGEKAMLKRFSESGTNSLVLADLPPEAAQDVIPYMHDEGLDSVFLLSANTDPQRYPLFSELGSGFLYLVSVFGVTGVRKDLSQDLPPTINQLKSSMDLPICVGFGISSPSHSKQVYGSGAWGAIVGSAIVKRIEDHLWDKPAMIKEVLGFIDSMVKVTQDD